MSFVLEKQKTKKLKHTNYKPFGKKDPTLVRERPVCLASLLEQVLPIEFSVGVYKSTLSLTKLFSRNYYMIEDHYGSNQSSRI